MQITPVGIAVIRAGFSLGIVSVLGHLAQSLLQVKITQSSPKMTSSATWFRVI
ncbi:hypothetical protein [Brasilonema sp. UFV-L1]|uniref:hypothetical protein n=1 Tax=Brasilonema sp. UFV-L1 TaxID=2234130 RepID=UPI001B7D093F|nr:hypothetical protein [Brasilonema sp. UFV-L1]